jgi:YfiH family protein
VFATPPYSTSPLLAQFDCVEHGFFSARGGVSDGIYRSLNCGYASQDKREHIDENRRRVAACFGIEASTLHSLKQAHTSRVISLTSNSGKQFDTVADGMVSSTAGVGLGPLGADCAPVLFVDPLNRVVGAAHSGWKGALTGINEAVIAAMLNLGAQTRNITAAIGPAMQQRHYEVKADFRSNFETQSPIDSSPFFLLLEGRYYFDTVAYIYARLISAGIQQVDYSEHDTYTEEETYFSYRRSCHQGAGAYGRQISVIKLNPVQPQ